MLTLAQRTPFSTLSTTLAAAALAFGVPSALAAGRAAGPLDPPAGVVAPTGKTLTEVEPRTAINAANTPGDADATPSLFKITQPGSYMLTGNITGVAGKSGIEIASSGVTIDLNGFEMLGIPGSLDAIACNSGAAGPGGAGTYNNLTIKNGSLRSWGGSGMRIAPAAASNIRIDSVLASGNGAMGIQVGSSAIVTNCSALYNATVGISTGDVSTVKACTAYANLGNGIQAGSHTTVSDCAAQENTGRGILAGAGCTVSRCSSAMNIASGIETVYGCTIEGCNAKANTADGIRCSGAGNTIRGNTCDNNGYQFGDGAGIVVISAYNRIEGNTCAINDRGIDVRNARNVIVGNTCTENTTAFVFVAGNTFGEIVNRVFPAAPTSPAVNGNTAAPSTMGTTDPNANIIH